ncbi:MAG: NACHT domain-containing protein, partial [Herpetosiphonaceae bacterium]|nr:NACHT domain-containing protein [Herpetosiphonaceae bacterium]
MMSRSFDTLQETVQQLEQALHLPLPDMIRQSTIATLISHLEAVSQLPPSAVPSAVREQFGARLAVLRRTTPPFVATTSAVGERNVAIGGDATDNTVVTGDANQIGRVEHGGGTINGPAVGLNLGQIIYNAVPNDEQREQLVRYLSRVSAKLGRLRLRGLSTLDDKGLQLPNVYVMLATTLREVLATGHPRSLTRYATFTDQGLEKLREEYSPMLALPTQAIVEVLAGTDGNTDQPTATLFRAKLATEAVNQYAQLVVLGDPGGGKSTFMRHLAWALAERGLDQIGPTTALWGWHDLRRRLPVFVPLRKLAGRIAREGAHVATVSAALRDEMEREYDARRADEVLDRALARGAALLLFDGLDEVPLKGIPGVTADRITTLRSVREFCELHSSTRVIVTCRTRAFSDELRACLDWQVVTLARFTLGQIRHFTQEWYAELVERGSLDRDQAGMQQTTLVDAVTERPRLQELAGTPLLLTMMALVLYEKGVLPRDRPTLYENILEQLLGVWDQQKGDESLASVIGDDKVQSAQLRDLLDKLSYDAHGAATSADGRGRLPRRTLMLELSETLERIRVSGAWEAAQRCLAYFDERSGLLVPEDDGEYYAFAHLTIQEYCAGRHLLLGSKAVERVMEQRADDRWREPIMLGIGAIHTQYASMAADRIEAILGRLVNANERGRPKP